MFKHACMCVHSHNTHLQSKYVFFFESIIHLLEQIKPLPLIHSFLPFFMKFILYVFVTSISFLHFYHTVSPFLSSFLLLLLLVHPFSKRFLEVFFCYNNHITLGNIFCFNCLFFVIFTHTHITFSQIYITKARHWSKEKEKPFPVLPVFRHQVFLDLAHCVFGPIICLSGPVWHGKGFSPTNQNKSSKKAILSFTRPLHFLPLIFLAHFYSSISLLILIAASLLHSLNFFRNVPVFLIIYTHTHTLAFGFSDIFHLTTHSLRIFSHIALLWRWSHAILGCHRTIFFLSSFRYLSYLKMQLKWVKTWSNTYLNWNLTWMVFAYQDYSGYQCLKRILSKMFDQIFWI